MLQFFKKLFSLPIYDSEHMCEIGEVVDCRDDRDHDYI